ncbi:MAG: hypothetical protein ACFB0C_17895 [Leptolyngbyaceae cyanobacterium]
MELSKDSKWDSLLAYFTKRSRSEEFKGSLANSIGRSFHSLELYSLAYIAYSKAVESEISVAKVNIASLLGSRAVPAAGLNILQEHVGSFDSADAGFPYRVRADLEESVQAEEKN